jgi:hypothetical protein
VSDQTYTWNSLAQLVGLIGSQHELANEYRYFPFGERVGYAKVCPMRFNVGCRRTEARLPAG